ncbi:hypothetical protein SDC9_54896 [bioreactor metagenome]|uniref:DUF4340 domain-containing protein n=1 Tax=bioreactor metagenome TaxID=1076179 RepID=A0A644X2R3_9ZZZZ
MNKSQKRQLVVLLSVLVVLCIVFGVFLFSQYGKTAKSEEGPAYILQMDSIVKISYTNPTATLSFYQDGGMWYWTDHSDFPLDNSCLRKITDLLDALPAVRVIESPEAPKAYGFDDSYGSITAVSEDGKSVTLTLGNLTGENYYIKRSDSDTVYTVDKTIYKYLSRSIYSMALLPEIPAFSAETMDSLTIEGAFDTTFTFDHTAAADGKIVTTIYRDGTDVTGEAVTKQLVSEMIGLNYVACVAYDATEEDLETSLIAGKGAPTFAVTVNYTDEKGNAGVYHMDAGYIEGASFAFCAVTGDTGIYTMRSDYLSGVIATASKGYDEANKLFERKSEQS